MKTLLRIALMVALLFPLAGHSQEVKEGKIKIGKDQKNGFIATSKYGKTQVEDAIIGTLNDAGIKKYKKKKKFYVYKEISWPAISPNKIDLYYKVSKKKHKSKIYMVVSKGYDNYVTTANDPATAGNITGFLAQIDPKVAHNEQIKAKEQEVKLANEKLVKEKEDVKKSQSEKSQKTKELHELKRTYTQ
jgi:hypothetical protein